MNVGRNLVNHKKEVAHDQEDDKDNDAFRLGAEGCVHPSECEYASQTITKLQCWHVFHSQTCVQRVCF